MKWSLLLVTHCFIVKFKWQLNEINKITNNKAPLKEIKKSSVHKYKHHTLILKHFIHFKHVSFYTFLKTSRSPSVLSCSHTTRKQVETPRFPPGLVKLSFIVSSRVHKADQMVPQHPLEVWWPVGCILVSLMQVSCAGMFLTEECLFLSWLLQSAAAVCFHLQHLDDAEEREKTSTSTGTTPPPPHPPSPPPAKQKAALTCLRKIRWSRLRLGLSGDWHRSRSGERDPSTPKTFSSSKHPVSIIYRRGGELRFCSE